MAQNIGLNVQPPNRSARTLIVRFTALYRYAAR